MSAGCLEEKRNDDGLTSGKRLTFLKKKEKKEEEEALENMEAQQVLHFVPSGECNRGGVG